MSVFPVVDAPPKPRSRFRAVMDRLLARRASQISLFIVVLFVLCALVPFWLAPHDPFAQSLTTRLLPLPGMPRGTFEHLLGTDPLGRDILSRIIYGARITLFVSFFAVAVAGVVGIAAGLIGGFYGGRIDAVLQRLIEIQLAFPLILLVIAVVAVVGPSLTNLIVIMGLSGWPRFARVVRGSVLSVRGLEYVEAARAIGASKLRVMANHILPNILSAVIVYASFDLARMLLLEATLSFLGLGVQPPSPTWGGMINDGSKYISMAWWVSLVPGIAIALVILAFNILGDELRDALDPQMEEG